LKITKFVHSCLLVEMPEPTNRTALFNPGMMSAEALDVDKLEHLDDIIITHSHGDHFSPELVAKLVQKFPKVRITSTPEVVAALAEKGIQATDQSSDGIELFESAHENVTPLYPQPQHTGVHYLGLLTDPGDNHHFGETKTVLAMPMTAPWGSMIAAVNLSLKLKPKYIIPIHDWHWKDVALAGTYHDIENILAAQNITFIQPKTGVPFLLDV
jgi:L-ascorbate metabolism protein UlaG (beta-lactamase superfamily)